MYQVINPATGELVAEYPLATDAQIGEVVSRSHQAYLSWRDTPIEERARLVKRVAQLFAERTDELAAIITREMGKRIEESKGELQTVFEIFTYYAENGPALIADEALAIQGGNALIQKRPIGSLIGIMPWNYPYYQVARFAAPNLMLGNTIILKHARNCPESAAAIESIMVEAGLPADAYINVYASAAQIATMLTDDRIQGISLTGSERAGSAVAMEAGRNLKKVVLELGGSDPMVLLDSSDLDKSVEIAVEARMGNNGQACNAPKRMIVMEDLYEVFVAKLTERFAAFEAGDPADPATTLAPLSSQAAADELVGQIADAVAKGATLHTGGTHIEGPGAYVSPAVLTGVTKDMDAYYGELFGPAVVVYKASSEDEAIELANDTVYGLGSGVFSDDVARARRVGDRIEAGMVYINAAGGSQADLPFGGIKRSGVGRELGALGMDEFMNKRIVRL
ncbi:NAD-dependent succinate-semialdehyde dehydrogenase [Paeniglutamicibacter cryotolerans]|uniref:Succinate-semialdehyde dehydrogenase/glutarate-semialdehyde dehydrogenase n=1 Tax=Paeniglutamicibacter cryotolerans TaxID=670079 RepID=A0A839QIN9_9MICC|nr:NAD-dependent succinate-semialdehyde dehydrogenase [Paeniglutamicibacter cryotolerans]MBB2995720.1 succinate-semialdehyde dehydrogenase/glutarate-semialdehyde dehydrogenase [Paeniglutamicibacter cryotolerans]